MCGDVIVLAQNAHLCVFFSHTEWNSTPGPETGEYFTRWQRQC